MRVVRAESALADFDRTLAQSQCLFEVSAVVGDDGEVLETAGDERMTLPEMGNADL